MSLFVINGILTFMLTPGERWMSDRTLSAAYLNPTYLPSLLLRTLVAWSLAAVWGFLPATLIKSPGVRKRIMHATALWVTPAYILMPLAALWYLAAVPRSVDRGLRGGMHGMAAGNLSVATRVLMVVVMASSTMGLIVYFGPWKNPQSFTRGQAIGLMILALVATGSTEWVREVLRKPFVVRGVLYSSGVRSSRSPSCKPPATCRLRSGRASSRTRTATPSSPAARRSSAASAWRATPAAATAGSTG